MQYRTRLNRRRFTADRESEKFSIVNIKDLTWYAHAKSILREWADQFVRIANKQPGEIVKDSAPFDVRQGA